MKLTYTYLNCLTKKKVLFLFNKTLYHKLLIILQTTLFLSNCHNNKQFLRNCEVRTPAETFEKIKTKLGKHIPCFVLIQQESHHYPVPLTLLLLIGINLLIKYLLHKVLKYGIYYFKYIHI